MEFIRAPRALRTASPLWHKEGLLRVRYLANRVVNERLLGTGGPLWEVQCGAELCLTECQVKLSEGGGCLRAVAQ